MHSQITHTQFWDAIDKVASQQNLSWHKLAKRAKISASSISPCKRFDKVGKEHWMTMGVLIKILNASNLTLKEFADIMEDKFADIMEDKVDKTD
jgi:hypothetical protein